MQHTFRAYIVPHILNYSSKLRAKLVSERTALRDITMELLNCRWTLTRVALEKDRDYFN